MKRNYVVVAGIMVVMLVTATGCGNGKEADMNIETGAVTVFVDENTGKDNSTEQEQRDEAQKDEAENKESYVMENIGGKVMSIAQDSFVISRVIVDENGMILVMPGEGGPDEVLTTIHCTDSTVYEHWTIQGGGAGIEKKEAAFSDIKEGSGLEAEGYFDGEEFIANKVIIEIYQ
ncbi:MAG: hypothetical protein K2J04_08225 [Lachnospiraceae bacterium]|nr:hypothetical protein [Lachnospiraceae bacterium]